MALKEQIALKLQLADLTSSIQSKYQLLKKNVADFDIYQQKKFKPILDKIGEDEETHSNIPENYISPSFLINDKQYGIKKANGSWYLGPFPLRFTDTKIFLGNNVYSHTPGLIQLLTKKEPVNYTHTDLSNYKDMLIRTKYYLTRDGERIKFRQGMKYYKIINILFPEDTSSSRVMQTAASTPLPITPSTPRSRAPSPAPSNATQEHHSDLISFSDQSTDEANTISSSSSPPTSPAPSSSTKVVTQSSNATPDHATSGKGLYKPLGKKKLIKANCSESKYQYIYYDDPNELCERLYLLHSSKQAGNESVNNEILCIESELRERGLIY